MPLDVSYEEEGLGEQVTSSMELHRKPHQMDSQSTTVDLDYKNMKKSTNFYCSSSYQPEDYAYERKSVHSSASSALSINFSERFKHYKRHQSRNKTQPVKLTDFNLIK